MNDIEGGEQSASFEPAGLVDRVPIPVESKATGLRPVTQLWWLTGFCLAMAVGLGSWAWFTRGIQIHLQFGNGHGLRAENRLMHRGIEVGVVESVQLDQVLEKVDVVVRLNRSAGALACEGSRFWIERPMASIQGVRSLETILSGRYIAVEPGSLTGPPSYRFQGLETPPQPPVSQGRWKLSWKAIIGMVCKSMRQSSIEALKSVLSRVSDFPLTADGFKFEQ